MYFVFIKNGDAWALASWVKSKLCEKYRGRKSTNESQCFSFSSVKFEVCTQLNPHRFVFGLMKSAGRMISLPWLLMAVVRSPSWLPWSLKKRSVAFSCRLLSFLLVTRGRQAVVCLQNWEQLLGLNPQVVLWLLAHPCNRYWKFLCGSRCCSWVCMIFLPIWTKQIWMATALLAAFPSVGFDFFWQNKRAIKKPASKPLEYYGSLFYSCNSRFRLNEES